MQLIRVHHNYILSFIVEFMRVEIGAQMLNFVSYNDDRTNQSELMEHRLNSSKFIVVYSVQLPRNDGSLGAYNE